MGKNKKGARENVENLQGSREIESKGAGKGKHYSTNTHFQTHISRVIIN